MRTHPSLCPVLVGRADEVQTLADGVAAVVSEGWGRLLLIGGEAGVGKTRLAAEALRLAAASGLGRLEGQCSPEASVPYACFVNAIRRRTRTMDRDQLATLFEGSAALSAALLPEVARQVGLPASDPAPEDLFAAVWQLLGRLARPAGTVVLLEDLHWADADSLRLLRYLAAELDDLPVWLVGTYRSDELHRRHPFGLLLAELGRERRYDEVLLEPLDREQVRAMVSAIFDGTDVGDEFADAVLSRTAGNPFFVEELASALVERGDVYHAADDWQRRELADIEMPLSVRETLVARARALPPVAVRMLQTAALASDDLDVAVLAEAVGVSREEVDDVVRQGLDLQLLVERRDDPRTRYAFRHALTREAFADELVGPDRRHVHRAVAEALVRVHADDLGSVAASVADHFEAVGDDAAAFEFARRAARVARAASAGDEADRRYDQALRLLPHSDEQRLELLLEAAGHGDVDSISRLRVSFAQAARQLAAERADPVAQARAIYVLEQERWLAGNGTGSLELLTQARGLVAGVDEFQEAWVLRRLTRVLLLADRLDEAAALLPEGIDLALRSGNRSALAGLYGTRMMMLPYGPTFEAAFSAALEAAGAEQTGRDRGNVYTNGGYIALWCGDFETSARLLSRAKEVAERMYPNDRYIHAGHAWLLALRGDYKSAQDLARPLLVNRPVPTRAVALTALAEVAQRTGAADSAQIVAELWDVAMGTGESQRSTPAMSARARQVLVDQGVDAAIPLFWEVLRGTLNSRFQGSHWPFAPDLSAALATNGRVGDLLSWVAEVGAVTAADPNPQNLASDALCRAHLAAAQGDEETARVLFGEALTRYGAMPCPARMVEAMLGLADVDWRTGRPDSGSAAAGEAIDLATSIGASTLVTAASAAVERSSVVPVLATVLFTDIVGSTELAASLGDRAWEEVLQRHRGIVRRELSRAGGREIDTAGDGFLAAFDTPAAGIRCAVAISATLYEAGITVRAGLHTGECLEAHGRLTGVAVHIASRVCSVAGAREVLVSGTVKDLVIGAGIGFEDRGEHQLKGVPGVWRLYAVTHGRGSP